MEVDRRDRGDAEQRSPEDLLVVAHHEVVGSERPQGGERPGCRTPHPTQPQRRPADKRASDPARDTPLLTDSQAPVPLQVLSSAALSRSPPARSAVCPSECTCTHSGLPARARVVPSLFLGDRALCCGSGDRRLGARVGGRHRHFSAAVGAGVASRRRGGVSAPAQCCAGGAETRCRGRSATGHDPDPTGAFARPGCLDAGQRMAGGAGRRGNGCHRASRRARGLRRWHVVRPGSRVRSGTFAGHERQRVAVAR